VRVRQPYQRLSKADLLDRLLAAERSAAKWEQRSLAHQDDALCWDCVQKQQKSASRFLRNSRGEIFLTTNAHCISLEGLSCWVIISERTMGKKLA